MTWTLRPGQLDDAEAILHLWAGADVQPTLTDNLASLSKLISHDPLAMIVADTGESIVGTVIAAWDGWRGTIYRLVVDPSQQRLGLGTRLREAAESRLYAAGAVRLQTFAVETDPQAKRFWQASDWHQQVQRLRFVKD